MSREVRKTVDIETGLPILLIIILLFIVVCLASMFVDIDIQTDPSGSIDRIEAMQSDRFASHSCRSVISYL